ncbi:hypothetical protein [Arthrobacter luteolus]|nr:hypothetical protein [Arthrobacter luteolus]
MSPDPYRCDCRVITEQAEKDGAFCGVHNNKGGFFYTPEPKTDWWN